MNTTQFILEHRQDNIQTLALQRSRYPSVDIDFALQQIQGWQLTQKKLPQIAQINNWLYPKRISTEQASSETTAIYKQQLISQLNIQSLADLTGGMGIDCFYMSQHAQQTIYVEKEQELCNLATHNFSITNKNIQVINSTAEQFLNNTNTLDCIYLDPARRNTNGQKVFLLEQCQPNIAELYNTLINKAKYILIKLSPMLDIQQALHTLNNTQQIHTIALQGEVKELLFLIEKDFNQEPTFFAANLLTNQPTLQFTHSQLLNAQTNYATQPLSFIYEPNPAIMKTEAYKLLSQKYNLLKLAPNSHLFTADQLIRNFPGKIFQVISHANKKNLNKQHLSVIAKNYPLTAQQIKNKYKLQESDSQFLIATQLQQQPIMLLTQIIR